MKEKMKLTPLEKSWILYDIGNSAFILLVTTLIPIYFNALSSAAGLDESKYLAYWGYAGSVATLLVAFIGPICGTLADQKGYKKPIFLLAMMLGALGCAALGTAWSWLSFLVIFVIARVGYNSANVFYDAMLPEVATPERMDRVSSLGYAFGYIGSVIPFVLCLVLVLLHDSFGLSQSAAFPLHLRIPSWAKGATAAIEGEIIPAQAGTILTINRQWNDGDELLLTLPMTVELLPGFHQAVSVARGPLRFAYAPETEAGEDGTLRAQSGTTSIFIKPGYRFRLVDGLITNFHLPESTLVMLVSAFAGRENVLNAYREAVQEKYRFFSFGDAMFIG